MGGRYSYSQQFILISTTGYTTYLAKVSEYEKNPWAAGWFINLVTKTMVVSTDAIKDIDPIMI